MTVRVIGDSHSLSFASVPGFAIHHLGEVKAFSIEQWRDDVYSFSGRYPEDDVWLFSAGEVDCRISIFDSEDFGCLPLSRIWEPVRRYMLFLDELRDSLPNLMPLAVPPQGYQGNYYGVERYADRSQRQWITDIFNRFLRLEAKSVGFKVFDPWDRVHVGEDGLVPENLFMEDACHLREDVVLAAVEPYLKEFHESARG